MPSKLRNAIHNELFFTRNNSLVTRNQQWNEPKDKKTDQLLSLNGFVHRCLIHNFTNPDEDVNDKKKIARIH